MAFPTSPANNQIALVNGIEYYYNTTKGAWYRYGDATANVITANTFQALSSFIFSDGSIQTTAAGAAIDSYARTTSNTASNNITIIQGVDTTQNTRITAVDTYAASAYGKANTSIQTTGDQTLTGNLTITKDLSISGNLTVLGTATTINTTSLSVSDLLIKLGIGNYTSDLLDIGLSAHYNDGTNAHTGFIRDAANKEWYVFKGYTPEHSSNNNIDINHASFAKANVNVDYLKGNLIATSSVVNGLEIYPYITSAYSTANTNATNITNIQGVNTTQNTNISAVDAYATGAYGKANTVASDLNNFASLYAGIETTQNTRISAIETYAQSGYGQANAATTLAQASFNTANTNATNITILQGVNDNQNTRITIAEGVDADQNTRMSIIEGVNTTQNTNITAVDAYATGAYGKANSANVLAQAAFDAANTAIDQTARNTANTASNNITIIQGVNTTQNTNISAVDAYAAGAYGKANSAAVLAQAAFDAANTGGGGSSLDTYARTTANSAVALAQAAFDTANTGGGVAVENYNTRAYTSNGVSTTFTISAGHSANSILVFENGVCQEPIADYTVSGTTLTFLGGAPTVNTRIQIRELPI
jgi:hypothetical protein